MSADPLVSDYACAEHVALALLPVPGLAAVLLGGVGDDWLRQPVYPYAVVRPESAEQPRGGVTRTIRARIAVRAADGASKPDPTPTGLFTDWTFAAGLLAAAQAAFVERPDLATDSHLEIAGAQHSTSTIPEIYLVANGHTAAEESHSVSFAEVDVSADNLTALMVDGMPWALAVVPVGGTVATRTARTLLRVGAGPALDALVQAARDALAAAPLGAPLESIGTEYDTDSQFPVQSAELSIVLADAQAFGDSF